MEHISSKDLYQLEFSSLENLIDQDNVVRFVQ